MLRYVIRRLLIMIPTLLAISVISFTVIQLPPGDFVSTYLSDLEIAGGAPDEALAEALRARYGLGQPVYVQYFKWMWRLLQGDMGRSMFYDKPVNAIIAERVPWSIVISLLSFIFVYVVGIPIGVLSATHQYSLRDYFFTFAGFIGIAIPNFLFALILLWFYFVSTGNVALGLFSREFVMASWSLSKLWDLLKHLWIPIIVIGTAGTCGLIRIMRANLLDELRKPYVMVARAKGLTEKKLLYKYPFRMALNPIMSTIGWTLPALVNGELLASFVLGIPTLAPIFLTSLLQQDMFLAGSIVMVLSFLTVIGTLVSDILLHWLDPRIRESV
ncbi:MAG: ABC transporter permease subunit [Firmicutes bacterium]|nr:ABC transporter permease subunit [Bacillota bacterium]